MPASLAPLLNIVTRWAESRADILGLALVGSQARGTAHEDSDVDLLVLAADPASFRVTDAWLHEIPWSSVAVGVAASRDADYGCVWSRHVVLSNGIRVEFSFGSLSWASTTPVDAGTRRVIRDGWRVLLDRRGLLASVAEHAA